MKDVYRKKILDALMWNAPPKLRRVIEPECLRDLEAIEPIIDDMIKREIDEAKGGQNER